MPNDRGRLNRILTIDKRKVYRSPSQAGPGSPGLSAYTTPWPLLRATRTICVDLMIEI